jgi:hypothetical protein
VTLRHPAVWGALVRCLERDDSLDDFPPPPDVFSEARYVHDDADLPEWLDEPEVRT